MHCSFSSIFFFSTSVFFPGKIAQKIIHTYENCKNKNNNNNNKYKSKGEREKKRKKERKKERKRKKRRKKEQLT